MRMLVACREMLVARSRLPSQDVELIFAHCLDTAARHPYKNLTSASLLKFKFFPQEEGVRQVIDEIKAIYQEIQDTLEAQVHNPSISPRFPRAARPSRTNTLILMSRMFTHSNHPLRRTMTYRTLASHAVWLFTTRVSSATSAACSHT
jgi:hypothetical protein